MKLAITVLALAAVALPGTSPASDTVSCDGKRGWQREVVDQAVRGWFEGQPDPEQLVELVQAEHGIVACSPGAGSTQRLHTTTLPANLELGQLGAVLLANELEWRGLIPRPEVGLAGEFFRIRTPQVQEVDYEGRGR